MDHFPFQQKQHIWHESGNILEVIELTTKKSSTSFVRCWKKRVCTRVKKIQLVQNPSVVAFSVHNLVVVAVLAHMTSLVESMDLLVLAAQSATNEKQAQATTYRERSFSLVLGSKNLAHQTVTSSSSSPNRSDACGLLPHKRDYCSTSSSKPTCSDKYFLVEILGGNSQRERERVSSVFLETEKRDENTIMKTNRKGINLS